MSIVYDTYRINISYDKTINIIIYDIMMYNQYSLLINDFILKEKICKLLTMKELYNILIKIFNKDFDDYKHDINFHIIGDNMKINIDICLNILNINFDLILKKEEIEKDKSVLLLNEELILINKKYDILYKKYQELKKYFDDLANKEEIYYVDIFNQISLRHHGAIISYCKTYFKKIKISNKNRFIFLSDKNNYNHINSLFSLKDFLILDNFNVNELDSNPQNLYYGFYIKHDIEHLIIDNVALDLSSLNKININILEINYTIVGQNSFNYFNFDININVLIIRNELTNVFEELKKNILKIKDEIILYNCPILKANAEFCSWCKTKNIKLTMN